MEKYNIACLEYQEKKNLYDKKIASHPNVNFSIINFLPEIRELKWYAEQEQLEKQKKLDQQRALMQVKKIESEGYLTSSDVS